MLGAASLFLTGCQSTGSGGLAYDAQEKKILNQARVVGALAGAGLGAVIASGTDNNVAMGALLGGAAGGLAGNAIGTSQANNAQAARMDNDTLRQAVAAARSNNDRLAAYNRKVKSRIAEIKSKPASERQALAKAELRQVDSAIRATNQQTASRQTFVNKIPASQSSQAASMNQQISRGQSQLATLTSSRNELQRMGSLASN